MPFVISSSRRRGGAIAALIGVSLLTAGPAHAKGPAANPYQCVAQPALAHPFTPFNDAGAYTLVRGGDMETDLTGWTLAGGATLVEGDASSQVGSPSDHRSLALPSGATATSAPVCIDETYPWFRLFARNTSAKSGSLTVEVLYVDTKGKLVSKGSGIHTGAPGVWSMSDTVDIKAKFDASIAGGAAPITLRFSPSNGTSWQLDDLYVDPRARG